MYDGNTPGLDSQYQNGTDSLCVNWEGFSDPHTGIGGIAWGIGRMAGDSRVAARNLTAREREMGVACYEGLSLTHNSTYFSTLTVYNGAMEPLFVTASSDGSELV